MSVSGTSRSRPQRLLVVTPELGVSSDGKYRPGGIAQFSRCVVRALAETQLERVDVWSLLDSEGGAKWFEERYLPATGNLVRARGFGGNRRRMALAFIGLRQRYDQVMFLHLGVARLGLLRPLLPISLWLVGIEVRRPLRPHEKLLVKRSRTLLSISRFTAHEMQRLNPGMPRAAVVHLCREPGDAWGDAPIAATYSPTKRTRAAMIVGRMSSTERYKGHEQLITAWPEVVRSCHDAELWVVGPGDDTERLRRLTSELPEPSRSRVQFWGAVPHEQLQDLYRKARVFVMPSLGEGFGLVFVEAMHRGLPCICSHDAAAEIVVDGKTGFVVKQEPEAIAVACARLLTDDELAATMSRASLQRYVEAFTYEAFRGRLQTELGLLPRNAGVG